MRSSNSTDAGRAGRVPTAITIRLRADRLVAAVDADGVVVREGGVAGQQPDAVAPELLARDRGLGGHHGRGAVEQLLDRLALGLLDRGWDRARPADAWRAAPGSPGAGSWKEWSRYGSRPRRGGYGARRRRHACRAWLLGWRLSDRLDPSRLREDRAPRREVSLKPGSTGLDPGYSLESHVRFALGEAPGHARGGPPARRADRGRHQQGDARDPPGAARGRRQLQGRQAVHDVGQGARARDRGHQAAQPGPAGDQDRQRGADVADGRRSRPGSPSRRARRR